jgi:hypothetical protein
MILYDDYSGFAGFASHHQKPWTLYEENYKKGAVV